MKKKADRLIKEFHTESDNEAEIEEVKSAVKKIQIEEEKEEENPNDKSSLQLLDAENEAMIN